MCPVPLGVAVLSPRIRRLRRNLPGLSAVRGDVRVHIQGVPLPGTGTNSVCFPVLTLLSQLCPKFLTPISDCVCVRARASARVVREAGSVRSREKQSLFHKQQYWSGANSEPNTMFHKGNKIRVAHPQRFPLRTAADRSGTHMRSKMSVRGWLCQSARVRITSTHGRG